RDHYAELRAAGAATVYGLSSQSTDYQAELVERLELPFEILSDSGHELARALELPSTGGADVALDELGPGRSVLYVYPMTGQPGVDLPEGWNQIPGARGCTPEACGFRDHYAELRAAGAATVYGLSSQSTAYQAELAGRLGLPFEVLSDPGHELAGALNLPTFTAGGERLYKRLTLIIADGRIEHVFYPIFPPDEHAAQVLGWLAAHPAG
ncbi:MAG: redoxin family protein, partial [Solirubrobacterales bacterium]|nr:redoxin family protein [Solirubrobacterales bacterium]